MTYNNFKKTAIMLIVVIGVFSLKAMQGEQTNVLKAMPSETCTQWDGTGIQFRWCETDWGLRTHQFYNGYSFPVHFYYYLEYIDGTNSGNNSNEYVDGQKEGDKTSNDNSSGTNKKVQAWRITKKERKDSNGRWVEFN